MPSFAPWYSNRGQGNHLRGLLDNLGLEGWRSRDDFIGTTTVPVLRYRLGKLLSWLNRKATLLIILFMPVRLFPFVLPHSKMHQQHCQKSSRFDAFLGDRATWPFPVGESPIMTFTSSCETTLDRPIFVSPPTRSTSSCSTTPCRGD